jgi:hypothetical protein
LTRCKSSESAAVRTGCDGATDSSRRHLGWDIGPLAPVSALPLGTKSVIDPLRVVQVPFSPELVRSYPCPFCLSLLMVVW